MKRITMLVLALVFCLAPLAFAEWEWGNKPKAEASKEQQMKARTEQIDKATREELASKEWVVYLTPKAARRSELPETDVLTFTAMTVSSKNLSAKGYSAASNYALYIAPDGTASWETMQGTKAGDMANLRGEIKGDVLTGSISIQPERGDRAVYLFSSVSAPVIAPAPAKTRR